MIFEKIVKKNISIFFHLLWWCIPAYAMECSEENDVLLVSAYGRIRNYNFSPVLFNNPNYRIKVPVEDFQDKIDKKIWGNHHSSSDGENEGFNAEENYNFKKVNLLIQQAVRAFQNREYQTSLSMLNDAEEIDPKNFQVKSMKGSVFFKIGSTKSALKYWKDSIALNPHQPKIKRYLRKLEQNI